MLVCACPPTQVAELIREAMMLGSLRHPNVVWVYGIVLPPQLEHLKAAVCRWVCVRLGGGERDVCVWVGG